ncbi:MAG TPA: TonB-dependent receptor, partial [Flavobacteriales bacterium]|nr:TonB-dependent receptor [Flavobacteriales bacterium]
GSHVNLSMEFFHNMITDYIYNEKLASISGGDSLFLRSGEAYPVFKYRQTRARLWGGEIRVDIHPHPIDRLHVEASLSFVQAENLGGGGASITDSTRYLPLIPPLRTRGECRYDLKTDGTKLANAFVKVGIEHYSAQDRFFAAYGTETRTPAYMLLNAGLGTDFLNKRGATVFTLMLACTNITDLAYQSHMNRLKYFDSDPNNATGRSGIYNMGRNVTVRIEFPFQRSLAKRRSEPAR